MSSGIINVYRTVPSLSVPLYELEEVCGERLRLYRVLLEIRSDGDDAGTDTKVATRLLELGLQRPLLLVRPSLCHPVVAKSETAAADALQQDTVSHFMLRFYFARTKALRNLFLHLENRWLEIRWRSAIAAHSASHVLHKSGLHPKKLTSQEEQLIRPLVPPELPVHQSDDEDAIYCVYFTEIPTLVSRRQCYLREGNAYFQSSHFNLFDYVSYAMKKPLVRMLGKMAPECLVEKLDQRVADLLENLEPLLDGVATIGMTYCYTGIVQKQVLGRTVMAAELDQLVLHHHFPPCMDTLHTSLRKTHHLRHFCRMQYGLFIKDLGVPYEEAENFWREEFTKIMPENKYKSEHVYKWRHQYGLVGRRYDQPAYDCKRIIEQNPTATELHGCPFKHYDPARLSNYLQQQGVSSADTQTIMELSAEGKYQQACGQHFKSTHGGKHSLPNDTTEHPLQWAERSTQIKFLNLPDIEDIYVEQGCSGCGTKSTCQGCESESMATCSKKK